MVNNRGINRKYSKAVLADCPNKRLTVGKHRGKYLADTPIGYQQWAQSIGYPDSLFERTTDTQAGVYC